MSPKPQKPLFLERATYRKRRMADAARLLPIFGVVLLGLPILWGSATDVDVLTTRVMGYIFGVWVLLAVLGAVLQVHLAANEDEADHGQDD